MKFVERITKKIAELYNKNFSVSHVLYCVLVIMIFGLFVTFNCLSKNEDSAEFHKNLFIGILSSTIVSMMIDIGSTKIKHKQDKLLFDRINFDLVDSIEELFAETSSSVCILCKDKFNEKKTFSEWIKILFTNNKDEIPQEELMEVKYVINIIFQIKNKAKETLKFWKRGQYNSWFTEEYQKRLTHLIRICYVINDSFNCKDYTKCIETITDEFCMAILEISQEFKKYIEEKYNAEDFIDY